MVEEEGTKGIIEEEDEGVLVVKHVYTLEWTITTPSGRAFQVHVAHEEPENAKEIAIELFKLSKKYLDY
ncbi:hypothetical protein JCM16138_24660 [Thermococcus atlanticus]